MVSCSSFAHGYFHVYRAVAARTDLDAVIHLGDYIYEYKSGGGEGGYGDVRPYEPAHEIVTLSDYRTRHALLHAVTRTCRRCTGSIAFIVICDDHETANDSYKDGAENHDPATEGAWADRKAAALQAYFEWMPIRDTPTAGSFANSRSETWSICCCSIPGSGAARSRRAASPGRCRRRIRAAPCSGTTRRPGSKEQLNASTAKWRLMGQQVMVGNLIIGPGRNARKPRPVARLSGIARALHQFSPQ